jgi:hypothetical protein
MINDIGELCCFHRYNFWFNLVCGNVYWQCGEWSVFHLSMQLTHEHAWWCGRITDRCRQTLLSVCRHAECWYPTNSTALNGSGLLWHKGGHGTSDKYELRADYWFCGRQVSLQETHPQLCDQNIRIPHEVTLAYSSCVFFFVRHHLLLIHFHGKVRELNFWYTSLHGRTY